MNPKIRQEWISDEEIQDYPRWTPSMARILNEIRDEKQGKPCA